MDNSTETDAQTSTATGVLPGLIKQANTLFGRIPDTLIAMIARFSIAGVFWKSAVDRPRAGGLDGGVRRASVSGSALVGAGHAFLGAGPAGDDNDHPDIRLSRCLANARGMGGGAALSDGLWAGLVFNGPLHRGTLPALKCIQTLFSYFIYHGCLVVG